MKTKPPDRQAALAQYRRRASIYDRELAPFEAARRQAIARLAPQPGEVVLDVGCGTGLSFALLQDGIGAAGRIVGIEQSPEMIELARRRVAQHHWRNVDLVNAPVESAQTSMRADAALFHFTHDILRQPDAVAQVLRHLKPGGRAVAAGLQWASARAWPVNLFVWPAALHSVTSLEGLNRPWSHLEAQTGPPDIETMWLGAVYIASGMRVPVV